jgi:phage-related protein
VNIQICQLLDLKMRNGTQLLAQNFFVKQSYTFLGQTYQFVPFQISGSLMTIGGDNETLTVLFPNIEMAITLLEGGDGNRNSELVLRNLWLNSALQPIPDPIPEFYVGQGSTFSEITIECRFRSALDSVGGTFPARVITVENSGVLPLNSDVSLQ